MQCFHQTFTSGKAETSTLANRSNPYCISTVCLVCHLSSSADPLTRLLSPLHPTRHFTVIPLPSCSCLTHSPAGCSNTDRIQLRACGHEWLLYGSKDRLKLELWQLERTFVWEGYWTQWLIDSKKADLRTFLTLNVSMFSLVFTTDTGICVSKLVQIWLGFKCVSLLSNLFQGSLSPIFPYKLIRCLIPKHELLSLHFMQFSFWHRRRP